MESWLSVSVPRECSNVGGVQGDIDQAVLARASSHKLAGQSFVYVSKSIRC